MRHLLADLVEPAQRREHLRFGHVRAPGREGGRRRNMADVDLGHLERAGAILAQIDGEEAMRRVAGEPADEAHHLLGDGPGPFVVDEAAAIDVAGHARDGEVSHEVLEPLVAGALEQLVIVEEECARDVPARQVLRDHEARDLGVQIGPRVCLLRLRHLDRADPARGRVGVVAQPDRPAVELELVTCEQLFPAQTTKLEDEKWVAIELLTQQVVDGGDVLAGVRPVRAGALGVQVA